MADILIVEDHEKLRQELATALQRHGYSIKVAKNEEEIFQYLDMDLMLLDLNLWEEDGLYLLSKIRAKSTIPVLVLTSRDSELDELQAIKQGADDFMRKPYNLHILLARIESILRRVQSQKESLTFGLYRLDTEKMQMCYENRSIDLSINELKIMKHLFKTAPAASTREDLMTYLWSQQYFVDDNTLTVNVNRIRKKLDEALIPNCIETVRKVGYRLR